VRSFELRETNNGFLIKVSRIEPNAYQGMLSGAQLTQEEYCFTSKGDMLRFLDKTLASTPEAKEK
jgi:hypothetical protein